MSYTNAMVRHMWANQSKPSARSGNGNLSFEGGELYSYSTCIARLITAPTGQRVAVITTRTYSVTTSGKHMPRYSDFPGGIEILYVNDIFAGPRAWLAEMVDDTASAIAALPRVRRYVAGRLQSIERRTEGARRLCRDFGLPVPEFPEVPQGVREAALARQAAAEARAVALVGKREAALAERYAELRGLWRAGERGGYIPGPIMLRVVGDTVETSRAAEFPVEHAKRAFQVVAACREAGREWVPNGHSVRLGHFTVARVEPNGNVTAGCHYVEWAEIEACARTLGLLTAEC